MLDNFRKVGVVWNHSTNQVYQPMRVASSDDHGRKLVVQVTNDSVLENTQEVELRLYWEIKDKKGFNDFELIDAEHGIYEIYFSRGMLENKGTHKAWLHATDTTGSITSEAFGIEVFKGIDLEAVEGTDDLSALTDALSRVVGIESQEQERQDNETTRIDAENTRQTNETQRESAELQRVDSFNNKLVEWDDSYDTAEQQRASDFDQAQQARANAYQSAESERDTQYGQAESQRDDWYELAEQVRDDEYAPRLQDLEAKTPGIHEWGIESGSSWVKFPDGTMIAFVERTLDPTETDTYIGLPVTFVGSYAIIPTNQSNTLTQMQSMEKLVCQARTATQIRVRFTSSVAPSSVNVLFALVGRWK